MYIYIFTILLLGQTVCAFQNTTVAWGMNSRANGNADHTGLHTEDTFCHTTTKSGQLFGLFDGHGDPRGTNRVCDILRDNFGIKFNEADGETEERFKYAFNAVETIATGWYPKDGGFPLSGSTAVGVYVGQGEICVAHTGDSRAIFFERNNKANHTTLYHATQDHNFERKDELNRVTQVYGNDLERHVKRDEVGTIKRVNGSPMSRLIGNARAKCITRQNQTIMPGDGAIIATPEITTFELTMHNRFIVIASDGLWDVCSNHDVMAAVNSLMSMPIELLRALYPADATTMDRHAIRNMCEIMNGIQKQKHNTNADTENAMSIQLFKKLAWNKIAEHYHIEIETIKQECKRQLKMTEEQFDALYPLDQIPMIDDLVESKCGNNTLQDERCMLIARGLEKVAISSGSEDNISVCVIDLLSPNSWRDRLASWWHFMPQWKKYTLNTALLIIVLGMIGKAFR